MIAEAFVYVIAVTLLIGLAALSVERFLAEIGRPRRYAWLAAYGAALLFPPLSLLLAGSTPAPEAIVATALYAAPPPSPFDWDALLIQAWALASGVLLLAYLAAWIRLTVLAKHWPRASDQPLVVLSDDVGPAVLGIFRPRIVLPRWLMDSPASVRSTIMAHELAHIAARDQALIVAAQLVTVLLPWNLPLWWFVTRLRLSIEVDCDARVLRTGVDAGHYADVLLQVGQRRSFSPYVAATLIEPVTQLERRIRIMLTRRKPGAALRAAATTVLTLAIVACVSRVEPPVVVTTTELPPNELVVVTPEPLRNEPEVSVVAVEPVLSLPFLFRTTPIEPPVDISRAEPRFHVGGHTEPVRFIKHSDGTFTVEAKQVEIRGADGAQMQGMSDRFRQSADGLVLEGNVKVDLDRTSVDLDRTSITAARAVAKTEHDGTVTLTLEDAVVTGVSSAADAESAP